MPSQVSLGSCHLFADPGRNPNTARVLVDPLLAQAACQALLIWVHSTGQKGAQC